MLPAEGTPPTLEQYKAIMAKRSRPLTDDPIGTHRRGGVSYPDDVTHHVTTLEPDILRRKGIPVEGERTPEQAAALMARKANKRGQQ
jgi:hypothetical protein